MGAECHDVWAVYSSCYVNVQLLNRTTGRQCNLIAFVSAWFVVNTLIFLYFLNYYFRNYS